MIITLRGCTATAFIGGLNFFKVSKGTVSGADVTISTSTINKDAATSTSAREIATVALKSNYENLVVTVTMGSTTVNWYAGGKVTIPANTTVTGNIKISASATAVVPDVPVTPTMYTFTINPTPTTATVTLTASGYTQSGKSITVPANTVVTWKVSASGYTQQTGTHTVTKTESKSVVLSETGAGGGTTGNGQWLSVLVTGDADAHTEFMNYTETIGALTNVPCAYVKPEIQQHLSGKKVTKVACYTLGSDSSISFYTNNYVSNNGTTSGGDYWQKVFTLTDPSSTDVAGASIKKEYDVNFTIEEGDTLAFYDIVKMNSPKNSADLNISYFLPVSYTMNVGGKFTSALPNFVAFDFYVE